MKNPPLMKYYVMCVLQKLPREKYFSKDQIEEHSWTIIYVRGNITLLMSPCPGQRFT